MTIIYAATRAWRGHCSRYLVSSGSSRRLFLACFLGVRADGWRAPPEQPPDSAAFRMLAHGEALRWKGSNPATAAAAVEEKKKHPTRTTCNLQSREGISLISLRSSGSGGGCILCSPCLVPPNTRVAVLVPLLQAGLPTRNKVLLRLPHPHGDGMSSKRLAFRDGLPREATEEAAWMNRRGGEGSQRELKDESSRLWGSFLSSLH